MLKKLNLLFIVILLSGNIVFSQSIHKEGAFWYFAYSAALDFNQGSPPVSLDNSSLQTGEGCLTISDCDGNLLFYSDGTRVYNREHNKMPNGDSLKGHASSTQSGVVVPDPGNPDEYYVFTVDQGGFMGGTNHPTRGIHYSKVDMTLDSGRGDVYIKNIHLLDSTTEKLTAVYHKNMKHIWVIAHTFKTDSFYSWLVTEAGVQPPVITKAGSVHNDLPPVNYYETTGYMKASPDGNYVALAAGTIENFVEVFDFDNETGILSNPIRIDYNIDTNATISMPYGIEFSPNSRFLYVAYTATILFNYDTASIFQYDMYAGSPTDIINSEVVVARQLNWTGGIPDIPNFNSIQLAIDGKIYVSKQNYDSLSVIHFPNKKGSACTYEDNYVGLIKGQCSLGLPNYIQSYYQSAFDWEFGDSCKTQPIDFRINDTSIIDAVIWNFDDPASGAQNTSTSFFPVHVFSDPGNYNVQIIYDHKCLGPDTIIRPIEIMDCTPMPVKLTLFNGRNAGSANILQWTTASEQNCDFFTLERSPGGKSFQSINEIKAVGNSAVTQHYTIKDSTPFTGNTYYRLKISDFDNSVRYSWTIMIKSEQQAGTVHLYPNPADNEIHILYFSETDVSLEFVVSDITGRIIVHRSELFHSGENMLTLPVDNLDNGIYFIRITDKNNHKTMNNEIIINR